jgi:hypothetical protein
LIICPRGEVSQLKEVTVDANRHSLEEGFNLYIPDVRFFVFD